MEPSDVDQLHRKLSEPYYRERLIALEDLRLPFRRRGLLDRGHHHWFLARSRAMKMMLPLYHAGRRLGAKSVAR
jgi:hypothetical protein